MALLNDLLSPINPHRHKVNTCLKWFNEKYLIISGDKDFQQLQIIKALVKKLKLRVKIIGCETIRDKFGLALSSRNNLMSKEENGDAREINKLLFKAKKMYTSYSVEEIREKVKEKLNSLKCCKLEYFEIDDLGRYSKFLVEDGKRIFIACWIGKTRLIDNIPI